MTASADMVLDDTTAWGMAQILARQALYRARVLTHRELQVLHLPVSVDLARTVLVWLIWDRSRGRTHHEHPGTRIADSEWPTTVPETATAYQRMLLEPLLEADPQTQAEIRVAALMITTADQAIIAEGGDHPSDGEPQTTMTISEVRLSGPDGVRTVACPVCATTTDLTLVWDGFAGATSCPDKHGEWLPRIGKSEWKDLCTIAMDGRR